MNNQIALILRGEISSSTRRDVRACLGIVIAVVLLYLPSLLGVLSGAVPFFYDTLTLFAPWREFARQSLHDGILPLWTPRIFCGMPFMANGQTSVLYPPNVLYWALPMNWALLLDALLHNALLALGTYTLARALGMSRMASCLVVAAWAMGGHVSAHINAGHFTWHAARAYMPWEMWATLCYLRSGARRFIYILAVLFALQLFSGYPPMVVLGAALCIVFLAPFRVTPVIIAESRSCGHRERTTGGWPFESFVWA
jgi:hypothetical protein